MKALIFIGLLLAGWACEKGDGPGSKRSNAKAQETAGDGATDEPADSESDAATDDGGTDDTKSDDDNPTDDDGADDSTDGTTDTTGDENASDNDGTDDEVVDGPCAGVKVGGGCWYAGGSNDVSCTTVCATHGGYNELTRTFAGSDGTLADCAEVGEALTDNLAPPTDLATGPSGVGCLQNFFGLRRYTTPTTADAHGPGLARFCACNN